MSKQIQKASGDIQEFSPEKLGKFLNRIQVPSDKINHIVSVVEAEMQDYITTQELRSIVTTHLLKLEFGPLFAARYNLKMAVKKLGPAGHLFEDYVGEIMRAEGYHTVHTSVIVQGECVTHEIDVIASKDGENHMVECKFHNQEGTKSDVTIALYVYARFLDVQKSLSISGGFQKVWVATNTKFTQDAIQYCLCKGINILTMDYPYGTSILDKVVERSVFPISSLKFNHNQLPQLYAAGYIILTDILRTSPEAISAETNINLETIISAQTEAKQIIDMAAEIHSNFTSDDKI